MKILCALTSLLVLFSVSAQASEQQVPTKAARQLFKALAQAFPEARNGYNQTESVFVEKLLCTSNQDEYQCTGATLDGQPLLLEGGNPVPSQADQNRRLDNLWKAMKKAHLPISEKDGALIVSLGHIACDHDTPSTDGDSYACGFGL